MAPLRVGTVPYLVGRPLDFGLEDEPGFALERRVPAGLVEGLRQERLDVALVSSIELFRQPGYAFIDGLAVAGRGEVRSVQVFLRRPLRQVREVVLDPSSRTAQALTRVVLPRRTAEAVHFSEAPDGAAPAAHAQQASADGWLEIGDPALRTSLAPDAPASFNPSAAWTEDTGLPFVFALWIVRRGVELTPAQREAFMRAQQRGSAKLGALARSAALEWGLPAQECLRYLEQECLFTPGAELTPALHAFRDAAGALQLCDASLQPPGI